MFLVLQFAVLNVAFAFMGSRNYPRKPPSSQLVCLPFCPSLDHQVVHGCFCAMLFTLAILTCLCHGIHNEAFRLQTRVRELLPGCLLSRTDMSAVGA
eukprot:2071172-Amphidinium_carterae.1